MRVDFSPPDISGLEVKQVGEALRSGWITTGPRVTEFEQSIAEYCTIKQQREVVCLASATAAMELALRILGVGEGDEVITSAYTFSASASVACHVGARPVLVDIDPEDINLSACRMEQALTEKTKAIIPVDIGGVPCDYDSILKVLDSNRKLFCAGNEMQAVLGRAAVIADCAHSFGARYKGTSSGTLGDFCCFSFHAVKNLTTAEGGACIFGDVGGVEASQIARHLRRYALHGQSKDALAKTRLGAWEYDIAFPGYKANMTDLTAAMGLAQLSRYPSMLERRVDMVARYDRHFQGSRILPMAHVQKDFEGSHHLYITRIQGADEGIRNQIIMDLAQQEIAANVHYKPLPMMTAYRNLGYDIKDFQNSFDAYQNEITLPLHTSLTDEQIDYVATELLKSVQARLG